MIQVSEYQVFSKWFIPSSPIKSVWLELWQPGTDEAHPRKEQVAQLTGDRKPTDCNESLSHNPTATECQKTEPGGGGGCGGGLP